MGQCHHRNPDQTGAPHLQCPEGKGSETRRQMASGRQNYRIPGVLAIKMGLQQFCLFNRFTDQIPTTPIPPNKRRNRRKVYGLKEVHATRIQTKTEYSFKGM